MSIVAEFVTSTSFSVAGSRPDEFAVGARVKADCGTDGYPLGTVTTSSTDGLVTNISMTMDSLPLTANLTQIWHGNDIPASLCNHAAQHAHGARDQLATATTTATGMVRFATTAEATAGDLTSVAMSPSATAALIDSAVIFATQAEAEAGIVTNRVMTPLRTKQAIATSPIATNETPGIIRVATQSEALSGAKIMVAMNPGTTESLINAMVIPATDTSKGTVELATDAEGVAGTDTALVTPVAVARQQFVSWMRDAIGEFPGMTPPAYSLFAPKLALPGTTTFSRASTGWDVRQAPAVKTYTTNLPRWSYDAAGKLLGLRIEGAATRLNTIAAAPVSPENIAVTAQAYTISFYGSGSMALSGAHAATVAGAGAFPARASYTFTPTAGALVLTPSGTVQHLQVEAGPFATTPILGEGSAVARAADVATVAMSGIDFNTAEGTIYCDFSFAGVSVQQRLFYVDDGTNNNVLSLFVSAGNKITMAATSSGTAIVYTEASPTVAAGTRYKAAFSFSGNNYQLVVDGGTAVSDTSGAMPSSLATIRLGQGLSGVQPMYGALRHFAYFPRALTTAQLQAMTL